MIYDFTTSAKGSQIGELQRLFHVKPENVIASPDANAPYAYRVVLGSDFNSCVLPTGNAVIPIPTPGPATGQPSETTVHAAAVGTPPPKIDGDLAEWASLPYVVTQPIEGQGNWENPADLAATWNTAWDTENLYLAVAVSDATFVQVSRGANLDQGDSIELWLDTQLASDGSQHTLGPAEFRLGLSPGNLISPVGGPEAYLWLPTQLARSLTEPKVAAKRTGTGYTLEAAVPWQIFGVAPAAGQSYGLSLVVNDDDTPGSASRQTRLAANKSVKLDDPSTWGVLVLDHLP